ncbi:DUF922 domain-containing protein [Chitinophaga qingshengii]|uniref:DUF922 domain-containing protein n=1 Tax=Chitinophaga qingshengii TaxID=1569794 RepID=A0ABR7TMI8_9BACT|nr:DUF922 domain-containing protein [Chitinophaga qingshengii]MBC9931699.1 hypothetical protein [Chitinophaga qingshengii]
MKTHTLATPPAKITTIQLVLEDRQGPENPHSDTIFYSSTRKLCWNDFQGKPSPAGPSAAVSYTSFSYEGASLVTHDTLKIRLTMEVFFIKSASWVRDDARDNYALMHEQLHFDITRLVVERFKQKLRQTALNRDDYDSVIQYQYLQSFQEMNRMQYAFDRDTHHGTNMAAQIRWRDKINLGLKNKGVMPEELGYDLFGNFGPQ